ncbi:MAG: hypothetical protein ACPG52_10845 [Cognaticolwellia sp.]
MKYSAVLFIFALGFSELTLAKQLSFSKQTVDNNVQFHYQWLDQNQEQQSLNFTIDKVTLFERFRNFRSYNAQLARKYVDQKLRQKLVQEPIAGVKIKWLSSDDNLHMELIGESQPLIDQAYQTITQLEQTLMAQHLANNFYRQFTNYDHTRAIKPDHIRFAQTSVDDLAVLKPLILNNVAVQNTRNVSNYVLSFVQSIPYNSLESRVTSTGAGFNPPLQTLWQNQGDCDSKVTLSAAIFRALMPNIKMMMVFIDNHALLAIDIPAEGDELTITLDGTNYILAEPTGPAIMRVGQLSEAADFAIRNGQYYAEMFFATPQS